MLFTRKTREPMPPAPATPNRRMRRGLTTALVGVAVTALLLAPTASAAAVIPYDNTDPSSTGCSSNAFTYWSKNLINPATGAVAGVMELRYSHTCQTNWVRVNNYVQGATARKIIVRPRQDGPNGILPYNSDTTDDTVNGISYGLQLYAPAGICVDVGAILTLNGQTVGTNGQTLDQVC